MSEETGFVLIDKDAWVQQAVEREIARAQAENPQLVFNEEVRAAFYQLGYDMVQPFEEPEEHRG